MTVQSLAARRWNYLTARMVRFGWLLVVIAVASGCATNGTSPGAEGPGTDPGGATEPVRLSSSHIDGANPDIAIRAIDLTVGAVGGRRPLVKDPGWQELFVRVENRSSQRLRVESAKVLTSEGRYYAAATSYDELTSPPDGSSQIAGQVATSAASSAAGQAIPYGGAVVGVIASALSANAAKAAARAEREFESRRLEGIELAAGGSANGSAFLPRLPNARALVIDYSVDGRARQLDIPLLRR